MYSVYSIAQTSVPEESVPDLAGLHLQHILGAAHPPVAPVQLGSRERHRSLDDVRKILGVPPVSARHRQRAPFREVLLDRWF